MIALARALRSCFFRLSLKSFTIVVAPPHKTEKPSSSLYLFTTHKDLIRHHIIEKHLRFTFEAMKLSIAASLLASSTTATAATSDGQQHIVISSSRGSRRTTPSSGRDQILLSQNRTSNELQELNKRRTRKRRKSFATEKAPAPQSLLKSSSKYYFSRTTSDLQVQVLRNTDAPETQSNGVRCGHDPTLGILGGSCEKPGQRCNLSTGLCEDEPHHPQERQHPEDTMQTTTRIRGGNSTPEQRDEVLSTRKTSPLTSILGVLAASDSSSSPFEMQFHSRKENRSQPTPSLLNAKHSSHQKRQLDQGPSSDPTCDYSQLDYATVSGTVMCSEYGCSDYGVCATITSDFIFQQGETVAVEYCYDLKQDSNSFQLFQDREVCIQADYSAKTCRIEIAGEACQSCQLLGGGNCASFDCQNTIARTSGNSCSTAIDPLLAQYQDYYNSGTDDDFDIGDDATVPPYDGPTDFEYLCLLYPDNDDYGYTCDCSAADYASGTGTVSCTGNRGLCTPDRSLCATVDIQYDFVNGSYNQVQSCISFSDPKYLICYEYTRETETSTLSCEYSLDSVSCQSSQIVNGCW